MEITAANQAFTKNVESFDPRAAQETHSLYRMADYKRTLVFKGNLTEEKGKLSVNSMTDGTGQAVDLKASTSCADKTCHVVIGYRGKQDINWFYYSQ